MRLAVGLVALVGAMLVLAGCQDREPAGSVPQPRFSLVATASPQISSGPTGSSPVAFSPSPSSRTLTAAQREYLAAYETYVRMLRESGPQTMETLNALADYQKKYQLYQLLLNADKAVPGR